MFVYADWLNENPDKEINIRDHATLLKQFVVLVNLERQCSSTRKLCHELKKTMSKKRHKKRKKSRKVKHDNEPWIESDENFRVNSLAIGGLVSHGCVRATCIGGLTRGFETFLLKKS